MGYLDGATNVWPELGALIFDLVLLYVAWNNRTMGVTGRRFLMLVAVIICAIAADIPTSVILDNALDAPSGLMRVLIFLMYAASGLTGYCASRYVSAFSQSERVRTAERFNTFLIIFFFLMLILNATVFPGIVRSYDPVSHVAARGPLFMPTIYGVSLYYLIYSEILILPGMHSSLTVRSRKAIFFMYILLVSGIVAQFFFPYIEFSYLFSSIGAFIVYFSVEVPDYRRLQQAIRQLREAEISADKANSAKSDFLASMSHEIRTPINAMLGFNEMILRENTEPEIQTYARDMRRAGRNLLELVNTILDYSKINAGKLSILPVKYELHRLLFRLHELYLPLAKEEGIRFVIAVDEDVPDALYGDETRLRQILENLLSNAVKFTEEGEVGLHVRAKKRSETQTVLTFAVRDTGIGIRKEDIEKLHQAFLRIDEVKSLTVRGTGLGLNIVESLLHMMGSDLNIESSVGEGSTFSFDLLQETEGLTRCKEALEKQMTAGKEQSGVPPLTAPQASILVVDDTPMNLTVVRGLLKQTLMNIDTAQSGADAVALSADKPYDLIYIDHMMPEMDGVETLHQIRATGLNRNTPCVALTANADGDARTRYLELGFRDYVAKPVQASELYRTLHALLPAEKQQ